MVKIYAVRKAYPIMSHLKADGARWDPARKAWLITQSMLDKYNSRTQSYGMKWCRGWAQAVVEEL